MIPDRPFEVLQGPAFMHVGTRNAELRPAHAFAYSAVPHPDRQTVTFFLGPVGCAKTLDNLAQNGKVAFEFGLVTHEAYQLKGTFLSSRPTNEDDLALQEANRGKLFDIVRRGYPEEMARRLVLDVILRPGVAVTFRVEEVYLQTPGPGAGTRIA